MGNMTTDPAHGKDQTTVTVTHTEDGLTVIDELVAPITKPVPIFGREWLDSHIAAVMLPYRNTDLLKRLRERSK